MIFNKKIILCFQLFIQWLIGGVLSNNSQTINLELLQTIRQSMNTSADPCTNFYQYACGNWEQVHQGQSYIDTIGMLEHLADVEMQQLLEQRLNLGKVERNEIYSKIRNYHQSCINEPQFELGKYLEMLKPSDDLNWPNVPSQQTEQWPAHKFQWLEVLGRLASFGMQNLLLSLELASKNATERVLKLNKPSANSFQFTTDEKNKVNALRNNLKKDNEFADSLQLFENKLLNLQYSSDDSSMHLISLGELQQRLGNLNMAAYLSAALGRSVESSTNIAVFNLVYMRKLKDLIGKTAPNVVAYYLKLKLLSYLKQEMPTSNDGAKCIRHIRENLSLGLDYIYEKEINTFQRSQNDAIIHQVFQNIKSKFQQDIEAHASNLSEEELQFLLQKIQGLSLNIGNLPQGVNDHFYQVYFHGLGSDPHNFYYNHLTALYHYTIHEYDLLYVHSKSPEHTFFPYSIGTPSLHRPYNMIFIPFTYLRLPIFHRDFHELFLYAELGNTLGHEMMHAFDAEGLLLNAQGAASQVFQSALSSRPHFLKTISCLKRERTLDMNEKFADFSGFRLAYETYFHRQQVGKFRESQQLTNKQLFFIKFAQFFCAVNPQRIHYDNSHDSPFMRVPQAVRNYVDFAQEFGCAVNAGRCVLW